MVVVLEPTDKTVFLVSGGAKGITAACVVELARRYGCRFILVGRSRYEGDAEPEWAAGAPDEGALKRAAMEHLANTGERPTPRQVQQLASRVLSQREISATLDGVAQAGGAAVYVAADVTDSTALEQAMKEGSREVGAVTGIIHGAGVLADRLVHQKSVSDYDLVVSVKVDGLRNLLACVPPEDLDFLVLFSSVAGFYGNAGQADYAVANEVLNKMAHWVRSHSPACHVVAVDWGPWDGGMVTPELRRQLAIRDIQVILVEEGTAMLAALLQRRDDGSDSYAQVVVGSPMSPPMRDPPVDERTYHISRRLRLADNPFLADHVIGGRAVLPTVCAVAWMVDACEQLYPGYRLLRVADYRALKGIVFDQSMADSHTLDLTVRPTGNPDQILFDALVWSQSGEGLPRYHYRAQVTLQRSKPIAPSHPIPDFEQREVLAGAELYRDGTLFHGPSFQGIESILSINETELTMKCHLPPMASAAQGQFRVQSFNPYLVDVQLQSLLVWSKQFVGHGGLPLRIREGVQYRPLRFGEVVFATMYVKSRSSLSLVADVVVYDADGVVRMEVRGAEITLSDRLSALFAQNRLDPAPVGAAQV